MVDNITDVVVLLRAGPLWTGRTRWQPVQETVVAKRIGPQCDEVCQPLHGCGRTSDDDPTVISRRHEAHCRVRLSRRVLEAVSLDGQRLHVRSLTQCELDGEWLTLDTVTHVFTEGITGHVSVHVLG